MTQWSQPRTCPACLNGRHLQHQYHWNQYPNLTRFLPGGAYCPCEGECTSLPNPIARMFAAYPTPEEPA